MFNDWLGGMAIAQNQYAKWSEEAYSVKMQI